MVECEIPLQIRQKVRIGSDVLHIEFAYHFFSMLVTMSEKQMKHWIQVVCPGQVLKLKRAEEVEILFGRALTHGIIYNHFASKSPLCTNFLDISEILLDSLVNCSLHM